MEREVLDAIRELLDSHSVLSLAVLVDGEPEAGLLPYAVRADYGAVYVQASTLARHARGLQPGARVGILIHESEGVGADPMQLTRLTVQAVAAVLDKSTDHFRSAQTRFVERFPGAGMTLAMGDFNLYELTLGRGRFVQGFARAYNVGQDTFAQLA